MNVFAKSRAHLNLTPGERAFLKLVESLIVAGVVAAIPIVLPVLSSQSVNWAQVLRTAVATFTFAVLVALTKYLTAQNDPPLGTDTRTITQSVVSEIPRWAGVPSFDTVPAIAPSTTEAPVAVVPAEVAAPATVSAS